MKTCIVLFIFVIICISCISTKKFTHKTLAGNYYDYSNGGNKFLSSTHFLELKVDGTFAYKKYIGGSSPQCIGRWEIRKDSLFLKCCDVESVAKMISNSYMNQREYQFQILNKNKLKSGRKVLKRTTDPEKQTKVIYSFE